MTSVLKLSDNALAEYLGECHEMMERFSKNLAVIERGEENTDTLASIYRDMHTVKGTSQLFGFNQVAQLAHAMETCLDPVRKGVMKTSSELIDTLYAGVDVITNCLHGIRETQAEPDMQDALTSLLPKLVAIAERGLTGTNLLTKDKDLLPETMMIQSLAEIDQAPPVLEEMKVLKESPKTEVNTSMTTEKKEPTKPGLELVKTAPAEELQSETIRVHVSLLDNLMNLVGELVLIRNQVLEHSKSKDDDQDFMRMSQGLNVLTAELQNEVMKTRMQPIGNVLTKFNRVVRDLGKELTKKIDLELQGTETELDKTIIEAVKDPLTHIVRNSIDHGVETPEERLRAGKKDTGRIVIKAYHESGQVIIEISDDGRGLDKDAIGAKAVEKNLITNDALSRMSEKEIQSLIFAPGFSTAASISALSGRGVGMDVVKTNIERIGGTVDLTSAVGKGTNIKLKIPLTLAIVPALIVRSGENRFAIPQAKLVELLRIDPTEKDEDNIETLQGRPVLRLRGKLLPLVSIGEVMGNIKSEQSSGKISKTAVNNVVVLNADNLNFGLVVDEIEDSADIVVKSLSQFLRDLTIFSGATVMGDGRVALALDVMGIAESLKFTNRGVDGNRGQIEETAKNSSRIHSSEVCEFLLVDVGAPGSYAIPLTVVSRLEEFESHSFEFSGEQRVMRYRDTLLPVFSLAEFLQLPFEQKKHAAHDRVPVVVVRRGDHLYGVEVQQIQDVVSYDAKIDQSVKDRKGILGTLIAQDRVIVVVDILEVIDGVKGRLEAGAPVHDDANDAPSGEHAQRRSHRIFIVEDSSFFRNQMRQLVGDSGYQVEYACDGAEGLATLEAAAPNYFSLVLSDIEMPIMDGNELVRKVRAHDKLSALPVIAVTTRFSSSDIDKGRASGFTSYMEKLNGEKLIGEIDRILNINTREMKRAVNS